MDWSGPDFSRGVHVWASWLQNGVDGYKGIRVPISLYSSSPHLYNANDIVQRSIVAAHSHLYRATIFTASTSIYTHLRFDW